MRRAFDAVAIDGTVVIGEGEMDEAPMLFIGEKVGCGGPAMDIAVDPLEGTTTTAKGGPNALAVLALAERGNFLHAPDIYMDKIAVGPGLPPGVVDLDAPVRENLRNLALAKKREISDLLVCVMERERHGPHHRPLPGSRRAHHADHRRRRRRSHGDLAAGNRHRPVPGRRRRAPEGVLAAAALRCTGGQMQGRLLYEDEAQIIRARAMGNADPRRKFSCEEMARGNVMFAATGVTGGPMLNGVRRFGSGAVTHSIVMRSKSGTQRFIEAHHNFERKHWADVD